MKKNYFFTLLFLAAFQLKAQLVSYTKIDSFTIAELVTTLENIGFGTFIEPQFDVDVYRVLYRTEFLDSTTVVSGLMAVPKNTVCKVPLVSYHHGTTASKYGVPSFLDNESNIAIFFASIGNVVVAGDEVGLGESVINLHPYMHGYTSAHSSINFMRTARQLENELNLNLGNQIFLFGYSQGGFSTAMTAKYIEQLYPSEFKVTAAAPMSGPYNIAGAQYDMVNSGLPYATPGYLPYIIFSYQMMYGNLYDNVSDIFKTPYDTLMPELLYGHNYSIGYINNQATPVPIDMVKDSVRTYIDTHPDHPFKLALLDNDLLSWTQQTPMKLMYCDQDEQVNYRNAEIADSVWNLNGAPNVESINMGHFDHGGCVPFALLNAKAYFESFYNSGIEIVPNFNIDNFTFEVSVLDDDIENYNILWSTGATESYITNIDLITDYTVTLTHKTTGCSTTKTLNFNKVVPIHNIENQASIMCYPNPAKNHLFVTLASKNQTINLFDALGKLVLSTAINEGKNTIDIQHLPNGLYYVTDSGNTLQKTISIQR